MLFKHIDLNNIFIEDLEGQTLLDLAHLYVDLDKIKLIGDDKGGFYLFDNDIKLLITTANKA